jgi:hypothetical protein
VDLLLKSQFTEISMDEPFMLSFVKAASEGAIEALLRYLGDERWISEEVLIAAIHNIFYI